MSGFHTSLNADAKQLFDHLEKTYPSTDAVVPPHADGGERIQSPHYFIAYEAASIIAAEREKLPEQDRLKIDDFKRLVEETYRIGQVAGIDEPGAVSAMKEYAQKRMHNAAEPGVENPDMLEHIKQADVPGLNTPVWVLKASKADRTQETGNGGNGKTGRGAA